MMYGSLCTEFYDIDKKFAESDEIDFYKRFFTKNDLVLEPMCGSGRLLIPLLQQGYTIHGLDNSNEMLKSCEDRAIALGLQPILFNHSIETMALPKKYNAILIPLGSFQLLYPRESAFKAIENLKNHLLPGGKLILDLFVPWEVLYENKEEEYSEMEVKTSDNGTIKNKFHNRSNKFEQYIFSQAVYTKTVNGQVILEENEEMYVAWYYRYEMELILEKYGFANVDYMHEHFRSEDHMIFVAHIP